MGRKSKRIKAAAHQEVSRTSDCRAAIEALSAELRRLPQVDLPLKHTFAPGVYCREIFMPKDTFVIGHEHKTEHVNIVTQGSANVLMEGVIHKIEAPCTFVSRPGVRKVLYIKEDMRWTTVHPTDETDMDKLESLLIVKSQSCLEMEQELLQLKAAMASPNSNCGEGVEMRKMQ